MRKSNTVVAVVVGALLIAAGVYGYGYMYNRDNNQEGIISPDKITLVYDELPAQVDPYTLNAGQRLMHSNTFEGLTAVDKFYRPTRALALSWGNLTPTEWEFNLRQGALFHDGTILTADNIVDSYDDIQKRGDQDLIALLSTIREIEKVDDYTVHIITKDVDPLLLSKLSFLPIAKKNEEGTGSEYVGTGAYAITKIDEKGIIFRRFSEYWGEEPDFEVVDVKPIKDKYERFISLMQGNIDILASLPVSVDNTDAIDASSIVEIKTIPSLEMIYLMFNQAPTVNGRPNKLAEIQYRQALNMGVNLDDLAAFAEGFATPVNQFISSGIFGFNPDIPPKQYTPDAAERLLNNARLDIRLTITQDFKILGEYLRSQLLPMQVNVTFDIVENEQDFIERLSSGEVEAYILGWRFDMGDSLAFLKSHIHTREGEYGQYNAANYSNEDVDALIEEAEKELDEKKRLEYLQDVQRKITSDFVGIPLFETKKVFAKKKALQWEPRIDGQIIFSEITL